MKTKSWEDYLGLIVHVAPVAAVAVAVLAHALGASPAVVAALAIVVAAPAIFIMCAAIFLLFRELVQEVGLVVVVGAIMLFLAFAFMAKDENTSDCEYEVSQSGQMFCAGP